MGLLAMLSAIALTSAEFVRGEVRTPTKHASSSDLVTQGCYATFANYSPACARVATDFASGITGAEVQGASPASAASNGVTPALFIPRPPGSRRWWVCARNKLMRELSLQLLAALPGIYSARRRTPTAP